MLKLAAFLIAIGTGFVAPNASANSTQSDAEKYYQQALIGIDRIQHLLASREQASANALDIASELVRSTLVKATELGHPAAAFYRAQLLLNAPGSGSTSADKNHSEACGLLDSWAQKGFVAAAVLNFQKCDKAYRRFQFDNPEHLAALAAIVQSLGQADPASKYYPFPLAASQCFAIDPVQVVMLTHEQFRAEAEYILGTAQYPTDSDAMLRSLDLLDTAASHGCVASFDMRPILRKQLHQE